MDKLALTIDGMSCGHCVASVRKALAAVPGVRVDDVSIGAATVGYDPEATTPDAVARAITAAGYTVRPQRAANAASA